MANIKDVRQNMDPVTVELGGKVRILQYDMNAFAELENKFGTVQDAMKKLSSGKIADVRLILWTGLIHEEAVIDEDTGEPLKYNITPFQVGSWIKNPAMLTSVSQKIGQAMDFGSPDLSNLPPEAIAKLEAEGYKIVDGQVVETPKDPEVKNS